MNGATYEDAFNLLCGKLVGEGIHRKVFECRLRDDLVVKVEPEENWRYFANVLEMRFWNDHEHYKKVADWLNAHPARKVLLHRDGAAIADSMRQIGLPELDLLDAQNKLESVMGLHVPHTDLFDPRKCCDLWDYLLDGRVPFNWARHKLLVDIEMQPKFSGLTVGKHVTRRLMIELASAGDEE